MRKLGNLNTKKIVEKTQIFHFKLRLKMPLQRCNSDRLLLAITMSSTYKIEAQYHGKWSAEALYNQPYFVGNHQIGEIVENTHTKQGACFRP